MFILTKNSARKQANSIMLYGQVLKLFKLLHRTRQEVFKNDTRALEGKRDFFLCGGCLLCFCGTFSKYREFLT